MLPYSVVMAVASVNIEESVRSSNAVAQDMEGRSCSRCVIVFWLYLVASYSRRTVTAIMPQVKEQVYYRRTLDSYTSSPHIPYTQAALMISAAYTQSQQSSLSQTTHTFLLKSTYLLSNSINTTTAMPSHRHREDTRIHHPQSSRTINSQLGIHNATPLSLHHCRCGRRMLP